MSYMKAVCCRVKANIKSCFSLVYHFFDFFLICNLRNEATGFQFFPNCHCHFLLNIESCPQDSLPAAGRICDTFPTAAVQSRGAFYLLGKSVQNTLLSQQIKSTRFLSILGREPGPALPPKFAENSHSLPPQVTPSEIPVFITPAQ